MRKTNKNRFYITEDFKYTEDKISLQKSGVYCIINSINNHKYIGSSINIFNRFSFHKWELYYNKHHSVYLQRAINKYGIENFTVDVLEFCPIEKLIEKEIFWMREIKPEYNMCQVEGTRILKFSGEMKYLRSKSKLQKHGFEKVQMLSKENAVLEEFDSVWNAAGFILYNGLSKTNIASISSKISDIARGNKVHYGVKGDKTVAYTTYGYRWKYV